MNQAAHKPEHLTDTEEIIVKGCRRDELSSQEKLYRLYYPEMIRICCRYAGDLDGAGLIYNNAMLRVFKGIKEYRHEGKLSGWIRVIVINCCLDFIKQKNRFVNKTVESGQADDIAADDHILENVSAMEIREIISRLPGATAAVFNLYLYENFTHKEIGVHLGISEGTSKWHVNEARRLLKRKLEHYLIP